jgi:hypothetical protein
MKVWLMIALFMFYRNSFSREFHLGVILGAPSGLSGKVCLKNNRSIDAALAYSLANDLGIEFHADYLIENAYTLSLKNANPLMLYYGIGARFVNITSGNHDGELSFGPRAPIGLTYQINNSNLELFGELALALDIIPRSNLDLEGGIGLRYRF